MDGLAGSGGGLERVWRGSGEGLERVWRGSGEGLGRVWDSLGQSGTVFGGALKSR